MSNANNDSAWKAVKTANMRAYCFTYFNYTPEIEKALQECGSSYGVYRAETCPTTKRPHLQGYLYWTGKKRGSALIKEFPGGSWRVAYGPPSKNFVYCSKPDTALAPTVEWGTRPLDQQEKGQSQKDLWAEVAKLADEGKFAEIAQQYPMIDVLHYDKLLKRFYRSKAGAAKTLDGELQGVWIYGPAGTGKSRYVDEKFGEDYYPKAGNTKWWDLYTYQDNVWIDDFDPTIKNMTYLMKIWTDRYKFVAEVKGAQIMIRPKQIIVTSNYSIEECFGQDPKLLKAMERRFPTVMYIGEDEDDIPPPKKRKVDEAFGDDEEA